MNHLELMGIYLLTPFLIMLSCIFIYRFDRHPKIKPTIIGLIGVNGVGKHEVIRRLVEVHGFKSLSFTDMSKRITAQVFNLTKYEYTDLKDVINPTWNLTPRQLHQYVGVELFRNGLNKLTSDIGVDIWIACLDLELQRLKVKGYKHFVITDIFFPNEYQYIIERHGIMWKVIKPSYTKLDIDDFKYDTLLTNDHTRYRILCEVDTAILKLKV